MIDQTLSNILREIHPTATVTETTTLNRGNRKQTAVVRFEGADPVVVQRSADADTIRTEARLRDAIAGRTAVPVARPLSGDDGWLVTPFVPGEDLHTTFVDRSADQQASLVEQFGTALGQLHEQFVFGQSGPLSAVDGELRVVDDNGPVGGGIDLPDVGRTDERWLTRLGDAAVARLPAEFDGLKPQLRAVVAHPPTTPARPRLFPWDFRPGNAIVDGGDLAAILDWEGPLAADPALSYAKAEYLVADWYVSRERAATLRAAFRRGYESVRPVPEPAAAHRVAAIASTAVDSRGQVTNPSYPVLDRQGAIEFHCAALRRALQE